MVRDVLRSVAGVTGARVAGAVVNLLSVAVLIQLLGAGAFGSFVLFRGLTEVLVAVSDLGIGLSVEKRLSESRSDSILPTGILLKLPLLLFVGLGIYTFSGQVDGYIGVPVSPLLIVAVALSSLSRTMRQALHGVQKVTAATTIATGERALVLIVGGTVAWSGGGVQEVIIVLIGSFVGTLFLCGLLLPVSFGRPSTEVAKSILNFSKFGVFPSVIGPLVFSWTDTLMVGFFLPREFVSAYEAAWKLSKTTTLLSGAIATAGFPHISNWDENDETDRISEFIPLALTGSLLAVIPATAGVFFVGESLLKILFSISTTTASGALIILVGARIPLSVTNVVGRVNLGVNRPKLVAKGSLLMMLMNITGNALMIPRYGLLGAASATASSAVVNAAYQWYVARRLVTFQFPTRYLAILLAATGVMTGVLSLTSNYAPAGKPLSTALLVLVGATVYFTVILAVPEIRSMVRSSIRR